MDAKLLAGSAGASVTREVLSDTAELIENHIGMTNAGNSSGRTLFSRAISAILAVEFSRRQSQSLL